MCESNKTTCGFKSVYFLRQLLINSGVWSNLFMLGLDLGAPTVLVPQLRKEANSTDAVTPEEASWLPTIFSYGGIPWVFILTATASYAGRKIIQIIINISALIGFIIFYCSQNVHQIMISEVFQGAVMGSYMTTSIIIITEYTSPEFRGLFLTIKSATFYWGILAANTIGTFFHWKNIPLFGLLCSVYNLLTVYIWPESPVWLAKMGRFDECAKSHNWLKGTRINSRKELVQLIAYNENVKNNVPFKIQVTDTLKTMTNKDFYVPIFLSFLLMAFFMFSGKLVYTVYAVDILQMITNNTSTTYTSMLIIDAVTVFSMYVGCAFAKKFKRRSLYFTTGCASVLLLFLLSLYLYLVKFLVISGNNYVSISLLISFSVTMGCGPMILLSTILGELVPIELNCFTFCLIAIQFKTMYSLFMKLSPYTFLYLGMPGIFLFFGLSSTVCLVLIYFYLPETKDKTLMEISDGIKGVKPVEENEELLTKVNNVTAATENLPLNIHWKYAM